MQQVGKCFHDTYLKRKHVLQLNEKLSDPAAFNELITSLLHLEVHEVKRREIYLDFLQNMYRYCHGLGFSAEKQSTAMSIAIFIFTESLEKKMTSTDSYDLLEKIFSRHISQREPYNYGFFTNEERKLLLKALRDSFYRHYVLYEIAMTKFVDYTVQMADHNPKAFPKLPALSEGTEIDPESIALLKERFFQRQGTEEIQPDHNDVQEEHDEGERQEETNETNSPQQQVPRFAFEKTEDDLKTEGDVEGLLSTFKGTFKDQLKEKEEEFNKTLTQLSSKKGRR